MTVVMEIGSAAATRAVDIGKKAEKAISTTEKGGNTVEKTIKNNEVGFDSRSNEGSIGSSLTERINDYFKKADTGVKGSTQTNPQDLGWNQKDDDLADNRESAVKVINDNGEISPKNEIIDNDLKKEKPEESIEGLKEKIDEYFESLDDPDYKKTSEIIDVKDDGSVKDSKEYSKKKQSESLNNDLEKKEESNVNDSSNGEKGVKGSIDDTTSNEKVDIKSEEDINEIQLRDLTEEEKQALRDAGMSEENINRCKIDQNGKVYIKTINSALEGKTHPETGVKYVRKTINLNGIEIEGVFPEFDSIFECELPEKLLKASDDDQFTECMRKLKEAIEKNPELASKFIKRQLERILNSNLPRIPGYIWHHNEVTGKMELVKDSDHQKSNHTGGKSIWGGGNDNR